MQVAEIFHSLQGEGKLTGTPSTFVRVSGCNLRCDFCDTPYTSWHPEGDELSVDEIVDCVLGCEPKSSEDCSHVVLTGGEPMLFAEIVELSQRLKALGKHITVETAGTLFRPVSCDLMSISPKRANSTPSIERDARWHTRHERARHVPDVIQRLVDTYDYQLKFVITTESDVDDVERYLIEFRQVDRSKVMLMPEGITTDVLRSVSSWLIERCQNHGFQFCPRKHIEWFGAVRGT